MDRGRGAAERRCRIRLQRLAQHATRRGRGAAFGGLSRRRFVLGGLAIADHELDRLRRLRRLRRLLRLPGYGGYSGYGSGGYSGYGGYGGAYPYGDYGYGYWVPGY
jgi:hypothetical protein